MKLFSEAFGRLTTGTANGTPRTYASFGAPTGGDPEAVAARQIERRRLAQAQFRGIPLGGRLTVRAALAEPGADVFTDDFGRIGKWLVSAELMFQASQRLDIAAGEYRVETHLIVHEDDPAIMDATVAYQQRIKSEEARTKLSPAELANVEMLEALFGEGLDDVIGKAERPEHDVLITRTTRNTLPGRIVTAAGFTPSETHAGVIEAFQRVPDIHEPAAMLHTITGESFYPPAEWQSVVPVIDWVLASQRQ